MNENWSPEEEQLRRALNSAAENVTPGPDGLARIRHRTAQSPWWRNPVFFGVAAGVATAAAAVIIAISTLGTGEDPVAIQPADTATSTNSDPSRSPEATTGPAEPAREPTDAGGTESSGSGDATESGGPAAEPSDPDASPSSPAPGTTDLASTGVTLPVYFVVDDAVTREWQDDGPLNGSLLETAVHRSLNGQARDPRYHSLWAEPGHEAPREPVEVISAQVVNGTIEVNLASPVELVGDPELAEAAVQQLVHTATATAAHLGDADGPAPVRILVDGSPTEDLFGSLDVPEPVSRAAQLDVRYPVQIDDPSYGDEVTSPVTVTGVAALFEATGEWELRGSVGGGDEGRVIDSGNVRTAAGQEFSEFSIDLGDLAPGHYRIAVRETDASGGEGPAARFDSKQFTVVDP